MKIDLIQRLYVCGILLSIVSCQKNIDKPFAMDEESIPTSFSAGSLFPHPQERPFKGQIVGSFVSIPTTNPAIYTSVANATGNVTHLGAFSKVTSDVINIVSSTVEGTFIMTNPGGEQITGGYSGTFYSETIPGPFSWVLNATISGGTGRFARATGAFVFLANGNSIIEEGIVSGEYTETFEGTIIY